MKRNRKNILRNKILNNIVIAIIVIILFIVLFSIGSTYAWFSANVSIDTNKFIVEIPEPETESAWTDGDYSFGNPLQWYFIYNIGEGSSDNPVNKYIIFIGSSKQDVIGRVSVWDDDGTLHIKYVIDVEEVAIETASLYAESTAPNFNGAAGYNTAKAVYAWPGVLEHTFELSFTEGPIYIAGHLDVFDNR